MTNRGMYIQEVDEGILQPTLTHNTTNTNIENVGRKITHF